LCQSEIELEYEEQYNPNHDFAIFGVGNERGGGMQTMKEKMNLADENSESASESEEGESPEKLKRSARANPERQVAEMYKQLAADSMAASMEVSPRGSTTKSDSSKNRLDSDSVPSDVKPVNNDLPEDNEIADDEE